MGATISSTVSWCRNQVSYQLGTVESNPHAFGERPEQDLVEKTPILKPVDTSLPDVVPLTLLVEETTTTSLPEANDTKQTVEKPTLIKDVAKEKKPVIKLNYADVVKGHKVKVEKRVPVDLDFPDPMAKNHRDHEEDDSDLQGTPPKRAPVSFQFLGVADAEKRAAAAKQLKDIWRDDIGVTSWYSNKNTSRTGQNLYDL